MTKYHEQQELLDENLRIKYQHGLKETYAAYRAQHLASRLEPVVPPLPVDFQQLYPVPHDRTRQDHYDELLAQAAKDINQVHMRLQAPLHQKRGGKMEWDTFPPLALGKTGGTMLECGEHWFFRPNGINPD